LCDVFRYLPARGPVRISEYMWPGTGCVVSAEPAVDVDEEDDAVAVSLAAALSALLNELWPDDFCSAAKDLAEAALAAATIESERDVSRRIACPPHRPFVRWT
jgi:hypothetical protein